MSADGSEDHLITPEGLDSYVVPPPMLLVDPSASLPVPQPTDIPDEVVDDEVVDDEVVDADQIDKEQDGGDDIENNLVELEDKAADRLIDFGYVGRKLKGLYDNGWFTGDIMYFNTSLLEYRVDFPDGSSDYVTEEDIDGVEMLIV